LLEVVDGEFVEFELSRDHIGRLLVEHTSGTQRRISSGSDRSREPSAEEVAAGIRGKGILGHPSS
jgi:hypothetical protein